MFNEDDVLGPKFAGVKILATPTEDGRVVATLTRADELVVIGEDKDGYINVQGANGIGWVKIVLVQKH